MRELLLELLARLEAIGDLDESLYDTVVRDHMSEVIFYGFIKPSPKYVLPDDFGMAEEENRLIKNALKDYIERANRRASELGLLSFHERLAAFQDNDAKTEQTNFFDEFFGWMNPKDFDEDGKLVS